MRAIITLTTDFGWSSPYVAHMKGVILTLCRDADVIDISHAIPPQDIRGGAILLADVSPQFPSETIHVAVIDPGVGTTRRIVYAEIGGQRYIAPDNGLLGLIASREAPQLLISIESDAYWRKTVSRTFHGRDIMAPVAAHLARGLDPRQLGPSFHPLVQLDWPQPKRSASQVTGEILFVDSFGNLITNIGNADVAPLGDPALLTITFRDHQIGGAVATYASASPAQLIALFDSQGRLEIAVVNGSAAAELNVKSGEAVTVLR